MKSKGIGGLLVITAASVLAACASQAPVSPAGSAAAAAPAAAAPVAGAPSTAALASDNTPSGYRRVVKSGVEYLCKTEGVTGSRTETFERCLTKAQMDAAREKDQEFVRRQQEPGT